MSRGCVVVVMRGAWAFVFKIFWKLWEEERRNGWGIGKHIVLIILNNQFIVGTHCRREGTRGVNPLSARMAETRGRNTWS